MGSDSKRVFGAGRQGLLVVRSTDLGLEITGSTVCGCVIVSSQRTPAHQSLPSSAVVRKLYLPPELGGLQFLLLLLVRAYFFKVQIQ